MDPAPFNFLTSRLPITDESAIRRLIELYGHLMDSGHWEDMRQIFAEDVVFELEPYGWGTLHGLDVLLEKWRAIEHPVGHHMTNIVVSGAGDRARAVTKGISIQKDGSARSNVYRDELRCTSAGWRITRRVVEPRSGTKFV